MPINKLARKVQQAGKLGIPGPAAKIYEKIAGKKLMNTLHSMVVERLNLGKGVNYVLDVGCGPGHLLAKLLGLKKPVYVIGLDVSPEMVVLARKRLLEYEGPGISDVVAGDAMRLPFRDDAFHHVVSTGVLHHIPSPRDFFLEILRVLLRGSKACVYEFSPDTPWHEIKEFSGTAGVNPLLIKIVSSLHGIPRREYVEGYIKRALEGISYKINFLGPATEVEIDKINSKNDHIAGKQIST